MRNEARPYARKAAYDPEVTRIVGVRLKPETLKQLRIIAADMDVTVCSLLRDYAERLATPAH